MVLIKRRLLFWLLKAYLKKWGKVFVFFFTLGLIFFFVILFSFKHIATKLFPPRAEIIGIAGSYTINTLPELILNQISYGLTRIDKKGIAHPGLAASWEVQDSGKTYIFRLHPNIRFSDGSLLTSKEINYSFSDVTVEKPDANTIIFRLKDVYAPLPLSVSRPVFKDALVGIGTTEIDNIKLNAGYVQSLDLVSTKNKTDKKTYVFYPTQESLKIAFALGEISRAENLHDLSVKNTSLTEFPNVSIQKQTDYNQLVTLFYNTKDEHISDKRLRGALVYALPNHFPESERARSPLSPLSWAYKADQLHVFDIAHAKLLLEAAGYTGKTKVPPVTISTLPEYEETAKIIAASWKKIGVVTKIITTSERVSKFQIFLGSFRPPKDPDQYTIWHTGEEKNITRYTSLRIDTLLEAGRRTIDKEARVKAYTEFQKYLIDDAPAAFLYYPVTYTISRK